MEKAVRGATKPKRAPPKPKYVQVLIPATSNERNLEIILRCLNQRLREQPWTEGASNRVLKALAKESSILNVSGFHDFEQTKNIRAYAAYLGESVSVYRDLKVDYATTRSGVSRLRNLTVAKGLLREVKLVQKQLGALLNCKAINEGVINVLGSHHYTSHFTHITLISSTYDALSLGFRIFYGNVKARDRLAMKIPNLKHANVSLTNTLEDYFNDPDFEINREQYRHSKEERNKNPKKKADDSSNPSENVHQKDQLRSTLSSSFTYSELDPTGTTKSTETKTPKGTNFDFFASIEQEQITIFGDQYHNPYVAQSFMDQSVTNPFLIFRNQTNEYPVAPQINQYTLSPHISSPVQDTNPFRSSIFSQGTTVGQYNPFQSSLSTSDGTNPFLPVGQQQLYQPLTSETTPYSSIPVDSNPFRRFSTAPGFQSTQTSFPESLTVQDSSAIVQNTINTNNPTFPHIQFQ
ncbi:10201_t:CDS:2 [Acaulospora colombiana]|uniref:10201_t:CDS:1 n=1 Tax=Acaulospora colombiana TaxID=27376 RepID=A0ACA9LR64_9GLOM|nr:10201_t:CDS:2 [Acaulospora colombiana]